MKIGIIGSGMVGQALGSGWAKAGHAVMIGTREPGKLAGWTAEMGANARAGSVAEAAAFGEIVVLATAWEGTESAIRAAGVERLAGKIVIDVTNPLDFSKGRPPLLASAWGRSGGEQVQAWLPRSRVVKAFNTIGAALMAHPKRREGTPDLFIAGNDAAAKSTVTGLATGFGWNVVDLGGLEESFYLEALAMTWIRYGFKNNHWTHAFKLLKE